MVSHLCGAQTSQSCVRAASNHMGPKRTYQQAAEARELNTEVPKAAVARGRGVDSTTLYRMLALPLPTTEVMDDRG